MPGLPKKYAKMGFKKGWQEYRKTKGKSKTKSKSRTVSKSGGTKSMAKNGFNMNKIYGLVRKTSLIAPAAQTLLNPSLNNVDKVNGIVAKYTGFQMWDGTFNWVWLKDGWGPYVITSVVTRAIPKINRMLNSFL